MINKPSGDELKLIPDLISVDELGGCDYRLHFRDARGAMEKVIELSMNRNWRLTEIYLEKNSLDAIFAELSRKNNA